MKKIFLSVLGLTLAVCLYGQAVDYNKVVLPDNAKEVDTEERLVQIAWRNNPKSAMAFNDIQTSTYQLKKAQWDWLTHINISGNLNEFTIKGRDESNPNNMNNFFPRYNLGISFSLGTFITTPLNSKIAREGLQNNQEAVKELKLQIRGDVLRRYHHYRTSKELYEIQTESLENLQANFKLIEKKFNVGETSLTEYNNVRDRYDNQLSKKIVAENTYLQAKFDLEQLLGLAVEEVL